MAAVAIAPLGTCRFSLLMVIRRSMGISIAALLLVQLVADIASPKIAGEVIGHMSLVTGQAGNGASSTTG